MSFTGSEGTFFDLDPNVPIDFPADKSIPGLTAAQEALFRQLIDKDMLTDSEHVALQDLYGRVRDAVAPGTRPHPSPPPFTPTFDPYATAAVNVGKIADMFKVLLLAGVPANIAATVVKTEIDRALRVLEPGPRLGDREIGFDEASLHRTAHPYHTELLTPTTSSATAAVIEGAISTRLGTSGSPMIASLYGATVLGGGR